MARYRECPKYCPHWPGCLRGGGGFPGLAPAPTKQGGSLAGKLSASASSTRRSVSSSWLLLLCIRRQRGNLISVPVSGSEHATKNPAFVEGEVLVRGRPI